MVGMGSFVLSADFYLLFPVGVKVWYVCIGHYANFDETLYFPCHIVCMFWACALRLVPMCTMWAHGADPV